MELIINFILYFLIFAFIHSLLATDRFKKIVEGISGEWFRFYRLIYNIISLITFVPVIFIWFKFANSTPLLYSIPQSLFPVFFLIQLLDIGILAYAAYQTDMLEFIGLRQLTGKASNKLITTGIYGIVRHPFYAGIIILLFTKMNVSQLDITAAVLISIYLIIGAFIEEKRLILIFGEEYKEYQKKVSMFIPLKWISG